MNANVSKTNGVRAIALVAVFAMLFAGVAVMMSDSDVQAAEGTQIYGGETLTSTQDFNDVNVRVVEDLIVDEKGILNIKGGNFTIDAGVKVIVRNGGTINIDDSSSNEAGLVTVNGSIEVSKGSYFNVGGTASGEFKTDGIIVNGTVTATNGGNISADEGQKILVNNGGTVEVKKNGVISEIDVNVAVGGTFKFNGLTNGFTVSSYGTVGSGALYSNTSIDVGAAKDPKEVSNLTFTTTSSNVTAYQTGVETTTLVKQFMLNVDGTVASGKLTINGNSITDYYTSKDAAKATVSYMYNDFVKGTTVISGKLTIEEDATLDVKPEAYVLLTGELDIKAPEYTTAPTTTSAIQGIIEVVGTMTLDANCVTEKSNDERGILAINGGSVDIDNNKAIDGKFAVYGAFWEDSDGVTHITDLETAITDSVAAGETDVYICGLANSWYTAVNPDNGRGSYIIDKDLTIPNETDITVLCGVIVAEDVTVTVSGDASIDFEDKWSGMYVFGKLVDYDTYIDESKMKFEVKSVMDTEDETINTYTSFKIALSETTSGTIYLYSDIVIDENLAIPENVTVQYAEDKDGTISFDADYDATLTVNGVLYFADANDKLDATGGTVQVNNMIKYAITESITGDISGAYFTAGLGDDSDGTNYITSVAVAAANSAEVAEDITIKGRVAMGDVTFTNGEDNNLSIKIQNGYNGTTDKNVTTGNVTLNGADFDMTNGAFTGTVTDGTNTLEFVKSKGMTIDFKTIETAEGTTTDMIIKGADILGDVTVAAGEVSTVGDMKFSNVKDTIGTLIVANGAVLNVNSAVTLAAPADKFNTDNLPSDIIEFISDNFTSEIAGTVNINKDGSLLWGYTIISGTLNVLKGGQTDLTLVQLDGTMNIANDVADNAVGVEVMIVNGILSGRVAINNLVDNDVGGAILVMPGSDITAGKILWDGVNNESGASISEVYINGTLYTTVYSNVENFPINLIGETASVVGLDKSTIKYYTDATLNNDITNKADESYIGGYPAYYITMEASKVTGTITVYNGMNLYIDGKALENFMVYNETTKSYEYELSVGTHQFAVQVDPGFTGTPVVTLDGQTVTGSFTIDNNAKTFQIVVTGDIFQDVPVIDGGNGDSGMGLTDYLLIILVVLIVIMAIMVAMRLMRS